MPTVLAVSPHLDDAVFSCGGTLARLVAGGWRVVLATLFTRSVPDPQGFALACQLDKGLAADVDYMALRRAEDREAARHLGITEVLWLDLPEAPHRGYHSAPALFAGARDGDDIWRDAAACLAELLGRVEPDLVLSCQGLGNHVDHIQAVRALLALDGLGAGVAGRTAWWRDLPYAIRVPGATPVPELPRGLDGLAVAIDGQVELKGRASAAYATQVGFQFGGAGKVLPTLAAFAAREGQAACSAGVVERFVAPAGIRTTLSSVPGGV